MARKTTIGLLLLLATTPVLAAGDDLWLHVRVEERKGDRPATVKVNVPVSMVAEILPHIDAEGMQGGKIRIRWDREGMTTDAADLRAILAAVKKSKDGEFVTVEEAGETVRVAKRGDYLLVEVAEDGEDGSQVDVKLPLRAADALFAAEGETLDLVAALRILADRPEGELVTVRDGDESIRIWIDSNPSAN